MQELTKKDKRGGKKTGYMLLILAIFLILLILTYIILGYFVSFRDSQYEQRDGLNRLLDEVPPALDIILPQWAGYIWFIIDCLLLLAMIFFIDKLFVKSKIYLTGVKHVDF